MKWFVKPETDKERECWDSGWRCGLTYGLGMFIILMICLIIFIK